MTKDTPQSIKEINAGNIESAETVDDKIIKEKKEQEALAKEVSFILYDDLLNLKNGKKINEELKSVLPTQGQQITASMQALKKTDILAVLADYQQAKEEGPEIAKTYLFFDVKNEQIENLVHQFEALSKFFKKDIIKDLAQRHQLDQRVNRLEDLKKELGLQQQSLDYLRIIDHLFRSGNQEALAKGQIKLFESLKKDINDIAEVELNRLKLLAGQAIAIKPHDQKDFQEQLAQYTEMGVYKKMSNPEILDTIKFLEKIKNANIFETFDLKNLTQFGMYLDNRLSDFNEVDQELSELNKKNSEYFPDSMRF